MVDKIVKVVPKKRGRIDSLFYAGEIAYTENLNGTKLSLIACGDIRIIIGDDEYRNGNIWEGIDKYELTDKKLKKLEVEGKLTWENNNWFEVNHLKKGKEFWDSDMGNVAHDYDSAIELLKSYIEDRRC